MATATQPPQPKAQTIPALHPYWLTINVGLTGVAAERKPKATADAIGNMRVVGGSTNLVQSKGRIADLTKSPDLGTSGALRMSADMPLLAMFGKRDSAAPVIYYPPRWTLRESNKIRAEVLNVGGESGGFLVFHCVPDEAPQAIAVPPGSPMHYFTLEAGFTGTAIEITSDDSVKQDFDLLILGAYTDITPASAGIRIVDSAGRAWCPPNEYTPVWAVAGRATGQVPVLRWAYPYLLPAGSLLRCGFQNGITGDTPQTGGTITFECIQIERR